MSLDPKYRDYKIVTKRKLYDYCDINDEDEEQKFRDSLYKEQMDFINEHIKTNLIVIRFIEDTCFLDEHLELARKEDIEDYLEYLAIKDGFDLVQFPNGNYGFIAYYNRNENGFEILESDYRFIWEEEECVCSLQKK